MLSLCAAGSLTSSGAQMAERWQHACVWKWSNLLAGGSERVQRHGHGMTEHPLERLAGKSQEKGVSKSPFEQGHDPTQPAYKANQHPRDRD